jgi:MFS superfamily sulfate permease-like transporter
MAFPEAGAAARAFRRPEDAPIEPNGELLAIGAANLASSLMGGLPAGGGASQTAVADSAGARSQLAQWVNAVAVLATVLLLSRTIGLLPQPALGAVILVAAVSMIKPRTFLEIGRVRRTELAWALATVGGVVVAGTLDGILIAVAISVMTLLYQANHPPVYVVAYDREHDAFCRAGDHEGDETFPGLLMVRTEGRLTFANTDLAAEKMHALVASSDARVLVLECGAIPDIEYTALVQLAEGEQSLQRHGVTLWLAAVNPDLLRTIRRSPLGRALGEDRIFPNLYKAVAAWRRTQQADPRPEGRLA